MSPQSQNTTGRLDLLLLEVLGFCVRNYVEPQSRIPLWDNGLKQLCGAAIQQCGIPAEPITGIYIGNLPVPIEILHGLSKACGLLPAGEGRRVGS